METAINEESIVSSGKKNVPTHGVMAELENLKEVLNKTENERCDEDLQIICENLRSLEATSRLQEKELRFLAKTATFEHHESNFCLQHARSKKAFRWVVVLRGSVFVDGVLCNTGTSVGRVITGSLRRKKECFVFDSVDLLVLNHVSGHGEGTQLWLDPVPGEEDGERSASVRMSRELSVRRSQRRRENRDSVHREMVSDEPWKSDVTQNALHCSQSDPSDSGTSSLSDLFQMEDGETSESKTASPSFPPLFNKEEGDTGRRSTREIRGGEDGGLRHREQEEAEADTGRDVEEEELEEEDDEEEEDEEEEEKSQDFVHLQIRPILCKPPEQRSHTEIEELCISLSRITPLSGFTMAVLRDVSSHLSTQLISRRGTVIQHDGEQVDSWMMVLEGVVDVELRGRLIRSLKPGDWIGICDDSVSHKTYATGVMKTSSDEVEMVSVTRDSVREARLRVEARTSRVEEGGQVVMETEMREGLHFIVKALPEKLLSALLSEASARDSSFVEDFLLTKGIFLPDPLILTNFLTHSLTQPELRQRAATVLVLWVSEFYEEFEENPSLSESLLSFHSSLHEAGMLGHVRLLEVAVAAKSQLRSVVVRGRSSIGRREGETRVGDKEKYEGGETHLGDLGERHGGETTEGDVGGRHADETREGDMEGRRWPFSVSLGHGGELMVMETWGEAGGLRHGDQIMEVGGVPVEELGPTAFAERMERPGNLALTVRLNITAYFQLQKNPSPPPLQPSPPSPPSPPLPPPPSSSSHHDHPTRKFSLTSSLALGASLFALDPRLDQASGSTKASGPTKARGLVTGRKLKASTISGAKGIRNLMHKTLHLRGSHGDLLEAIGSSVSDQQQQKPPESNAVIDGTEEVARIYRSDNSSCLISLAPDAPSSLLIALSLRELSLPLSLPNALPSSSDSLSTPISTLSPAALASVGFSLYEVSVDASGTLRQRLLSAWSRGVAERLAPHARLYIKNTLSDDSLCTEEILSSLSSSSSLSLLSLSPHSLAVVLSMRSLSLLSAVSSSAFVSHILLGEPAGERLQAFEKLLNSEMAWVSWEVVKAESPTKRAKVITFLIETATACRKAHNYNSTFAIISGLTHSSVSRLASTWKHVRQNCLRELSLLQSLFEPSRNMAAYRQELAIVSQSPPIVPLYALTKKDLTFIHLGNPTWEGDLLNVEKLRLFAREVQRLRKILKSPGDSQNAGVVFQHRVFSQQNQGTDIVPVFPSARRASAPISSLHGVSSSSTSSSLPVSLRRRYDECLSTRRVRHYLHQSFSEGASTTESTLMAMSLLAESPATAVTNTDLSGSKDSVSSLPTSSPQSDSKMK